MLSSNLLSHLNDANLEFSRTESQYRESILEEEDDLNSALSKYVKFEEIGSSSE